MLYRSLYAFNVYIVVLMELAVPFGLIRELGENLRVARKRRGLRIARTL